MAVLPFRCLLSFLIFSLWFQGVKAQDDFAVLKKNFNLSAKNLSHDLCLTKDTLILQSDIRINRIYTITNAYKRDLEMYGSENPIKIPLNTFAKGRHVFVVEQNKMSIVFVVQIQKALAEVAHLLEKEEVSDNK